MKNIVITAKAKVTLPDDAIVNADGSITIGDKTFKDICVSVSRYGNGECQDTDILVSDITIDLNTNLMDANTSFQRIW